MSHIPIATVPIIHQGLRQEETIIQITLALEYLNDVYNKIFENYHKCIQEQRVRLTTLNKKKNQLEAIIKTLDINKEAVILQSHYEFPKHGFKEEQPCKIFSIDLPPPDFTEVKVSTPLPGYNAKDLEDKIHHFHLKPSGVRRNMDIAPKRGLGDLPSNIDSVSSLLLFNTAENLYKKYKVTDPLKVPSRTRLVTGETRTDSLAPAAAPGSIYDESAQVQPLDYSYSPVMQDDAPCLDMPSDLLDVTGTLPMADGAEELPTESLSPKSVPLPPSPPETDPEADLKPTLCALLPSPEEVEEQVEPPPPPPPPSEPPKPPTPPVAPAQPDGPPPPTPRIQVTDARASLMEAIRKVGGDKAKLRSVSDRPQEAKRIKEETQTQVRSGGNLMADLHAKLSLRRKGISGAQKVDPMAKVLEMIPPPIAPSSAPAGSDTEDADWED